MYLVVGLGNPGQEYERTRHNLGFEVIEQLAKRFKVSLNSYRGQAKLGKTSLNKVSLILAKPQTFVNVSGESVKHLVKILKIPLSRLIVIHDDLDLPLGKIRIKKEGGSGGHKGVVSIISSLRRNNFVRVRIGIGRPPGRQDPAKYVLSSFTKRQQEKIEAAILEAAEATSSLIEEGFARNL